MKLTQKDFKIGQIVTCIKKCNFNEDILILGKNYEIKDVDFHFPGKICIQSTYNDVYYFMEIDKFIDTLQLRKMKIMKIRMKYESR